MFICTLKECIYVEEELNDAFYECIDCPFGVDAKSFEEYEKKKAEYDLPKEVRA